ncbi:hypothetical protein [Vibrio phage D4]|nr:hypothetical protein [Vibrio phage D4]
MLEKRKRREQLSQLSILRVAYGGDADSFSKLVKSLED